MALTQAIPDGTQVCVVVLNWNGYEDTVQCLESVLCELSSDGFVILIDNASANLEGQTLAAEFGNNPQVYVQLNRSNLGFTRAHTEVMGDIIARAEVRHILLINNDATLEPGALDHLSRVAEPGREVGMVASRMIRYSDHDRLDNAGHIMLNTGEILPRGTDRHPDEFSEPADVLGACAGAALYSTQMLRDIGGFDEFFDTGYEDAEHGLRAVLAGYEVVYEPQAIVYHKVSASIDKIRDFNYAVRIQRNINYTMFKLLPWQLLVINAPLILIKQVAILLVSLLLFRWRLFAAHAKALWLTLLDLPTIWRARQSVGHLRRISWYALAKRQQFFLPVYWRYFKRYIIGRKKTVFER